MAQLHKQQNFSGFDLSKLQASLYDMKVARGTDEYLARFVGWESKPAEQQELALFAIKTDQGELIRKLVFDRQSKIEDARRLKMLFALVFSARKFETEELAPTQEELEIVK
jgi:hypothetical protein